MALALLFSALHDDFAAGLVFLSGLLALSVAPWALQVLAATTTFALSLTTAVRMIDRVHTHTANGRTGALPAGSSGFSGDCLDVVGVADLANRRKALVVDPPNFSRGKSDERMPGFAVR